MVAFTLKEVRAQTADLAFIVDTKYISRLTQDSIAGSKINTTLRIKRLIPQHISYMNWAFRALFS